MNTSRWCSVVGLCVVWSLSGCPRSKLPPAADTRATYQATAFPGPPPWRVPPNQAVRVSLAGLPRVSEADHSGFHIHAGLRIYYAGKPVAIPAGIGLDRYGDPVSPVHTHRAKGVIHIEYPVRATFKWGQFFALWGVPLGGATVYANAVPVENLSELAFADQQQVVVIFGPPPSTPIAWPTPEPEEDPGAASSPGPSDGSSELASPEPSPTPSASASLGPTATPSAAP